ncbi:MAG: flagellar motor switch protein FliN [Candidatus Limnocylindrales bacterium]|jgi:flagellar motor switch protein FliN
MSWETFDWKPADGASLGAGASILPLWPMLRSAIAEGISADALCPVTIGELTVGHVNYDEAPTRPAPSRSFELLGADRRGSWAALDPAKGDKIGGNVYTAERLQELVLEGMDTAFESILGEGLSLGAPVEVSSPNAPMLLLRLPITSVDNEELVLVSAYDAAVAGELSAHVVALQALSSEASTTPPPAPAPVAQRTQEFKAAVAGRPATPAPAAAPAPNGNGGSSPLPANVRPAQLPELTGAPTAGPGYNIDLLLGVTLQVTVEIGRTTLPIRDVLALTPGSIIQLDKLAGEKVDILINGRPIAQGEVVVVDENFGVRVTDVVARQQRLSTTGR